MKQKVGNARRGGKRFGRAPNAEQQEGQLHGSWTGKNHEGGHMVGWLKEF